MGLCFFSKTHNHFQNLLVILVKLWVVTYSGLCQKTKMLFSTQCDVQSFIHFHLHLGFVHPLQDVALHHCLPSSSVCCFPNPCGSLLLCYVILPSSAWSSSRPLPSPWLPLCASLCPPISLYYYYIYGSVK